MALVIYASKDETLMTAKTAKAAMGDLLTILNIVKLVKKDTAIVAGGCVTAVDSRVPKPHLAVERSQQIQIEETVTFHGILKWVIPEFWCLYEFTMLHRIRTETMPLERDVLIMAVLLQWAVQMLVMVNLILRYTVIHRSMFFRTVDLMPLPHQPTMDIM